MLFQVSGVLNRKARSSYSVFQGLNKILLRFVIAYGKKKWRNHRNGQTGEKVSGNQIDTFIT